MRSLQDRLSEINPAKARLILMANALLVLLFIYLAIYCAAHAYDNPYNASFDNLNKATQDWGYRFSALALLLALLLRSLQGRAYWPTWMQFKKPALDERQIKAKSRAYENAYPVAILGLPFVALILSGKVSHYADYAKGDITDAILWCALIFYIALPSVLAAFQKDS